MSMYWSFSTYFSRMSLLLTTTKPLADSTTLKGPCRGWQKDSVGAVEEVTSDARDVKILFQSSIVQLAVKESLRSTFPS